jgi:predicted AAA+ superfamily ATPase
LEERKEFLRTYALTYMKEEVWGEQLIKNMTPFRRFLEIAAQCNGQIINAANIARDIGADPKTVQNYFEVLEDTLLGFHLDPFHSSVRKRLSQKPKFYLFDPGIKRALDRTLNVELVPGTYAYGKAFEHWVILEAFRINNYLRRDYRFSYLRTKDDAEVDLMIERPGMKRAAVEIKSASRITNSDARTRSFAKLVSDLKNTDGYLLSQDPLERKVDGIWCLPWQRGFIELGLAFSS